MARISGKIATAYMCMDRVGIINKLNNNNNNKNNKLLFFSLKCSSWRALSVVSCLLGIVDASRKRGTSLRWEIANREDPYAVAYRKSG